MTKNSVSVIETLFDDESTRKKHEVMSKLEIIFDDSRNDSDWFWLDELERFLEFGKKYKITFGEIE